MTDRFHTDRINNFCDAVFAIAMTLLILEIKVPNREQMESIGLIGSLKHLIPSFIGFIISFLVTGLYWRAHLLIAKFAKSYDNKQLWITILLLLFIVLLPFSTALYSEYFNNNQVFIFYCANLVLIGIFHFTLVASIIKKEGFSNELTADVARLIKIRSFTAPVVWALSIVWVFIEPFSARFIFMFIFVIQAFVDRNFKRKLSTGTGEH